VVRCAKCGKKLGILSKKYYIYPGKKKGSFEVTDEKVVCKKCLEEHSSIWDKNDEAKLKDFFELVIREKGKEALKVLDSISAKHNSSFWYNRGLVLKELHKFEEALKCFDEALLLDTYYTKAWYWKGRILIDLKRHSDAIKSFKNVIELDPENKQKRMLGSILLIAGAYLNLEKVEEAIEWFHKLYLLIGGNPEFSHMDFEGFSKYCIKNFPILLESLVQAPIAEFHELGLRH
jgi:tetratricopeptide (TPR) repeat protein